MRVDSAGVYEGGLDPFACRVMEEIGVSLERHEPKKLSDIDAALFDLVIVLTPEAADEARRFLPKERIEFWPIAIRSDAFGGEKAALAAYRRVRDELSRQLRERFPEVY